LATAGQKDAGALLTIGELSQELGVAQHILRYWETRFPQLKPLQRAGNRRYYRPADVQLAHRIHRLLNKDGYTIRGVQQLLANGGGRDDSDQAPEAPPAREPAPAGPASPFPLEALRLIRRTLAQALEESAV
jgi:DNA-binding transcriptional MerR regulator